MYDHCYVSHDFMPELRKWTEVEYYEDNVHKMQLPFTPAPKRLQLIRKFSGNAVKNLPNAWSKLMPKREKKR